MWPNRWTLKKSWNSYGSTFPKPELDVWTGEGAVRIYARKMTGTPELVKGLAERIQDRSLQLLPWATFTPVKTKGNEYIPCDIDTSPMNNKYPNWKIS
jgi:hypothetical protein